MEPSESAEAGCEFSYCVQFRIHARRLVMEHMGKEESEGAEKPTGVGINENIHEKIRRSDMFNYILSCAAERGSKSQGIIERDDVHRHSFGHGLREQKRKSSIGTVLS